MKYSDYFLKIPSNWILKRLFHFLPKIINKCYQTKNRENAALWTVNPVCHSSQSKKDLKNSKTTRKTCSNNNKNYIICFHELNSNDFWVSMKLFIYDVTNLDVWGGLWKMIILMIGYWGSQYLWDSKGVLRLTSHKGREFRTNK